MHDDDVIRTLDNAVYHEGSLAVLRGNLAPDGCVIKPAASEPRLREHDGPALVFDSYPALKAASEDDSLDVTPDHVLVLRGAGPQGGPGMPEWGMLPIPKVLLKRGVRDMLRVSDARMSGTSYGGCVLHVAPEAHVGGPLALVRTGDRIQVSVSKRSIDMLGERRGDCPAPARVDRARAAFRARLRLDVREAHPPGERGVRLRLPRDRLRRARRRT